ncbi:MAG: hypothetical protein H6702_12080 [Myxococcales bacterium]|nr:hypothetical protein [Myxococcales bacterium]
MRGLFTHGLLALAIAAGLFGCGADDDTTTGQPDGRPSDALPGDSDLPEDDAHTPQADAHVPPDDGDVLDVDGGADADGGVELDPGRAGGCTPDPDRVAAQERCADDLNCPCGTHCALGLCEADCLGDADCPNGLICDDAGRCAEDIPDPESRRPPPPPRAEGELGVAPGVVSGDGDVREVRVTARGAGFARARAVASPGMAVRCAAEGDFADHCTFALDRNGSAALALRPTDDAPPGQVGEVRVFAGHQLQAVVYAPAARAGLEKDGEPLEGVYEGVAVRVQVGLVGDVAPAAAVSLPVTLEVDADGRVALSDDLGTWQPDGQPWIGQLEGAGDALRLALPARPWLEGAQTAFVAGLSAAEVPVAFAPGSLRLDLPITYQGLTATLAPEAPDGCADRLACVQGCDFEPLCALRCLEGLPQASRALAEAVGLCGVRRCLPSPSAQCVAAECADELAACEADAPAPEAAPVPPEPTSTWRIAVRRVGDRADRPLPAAAPAPALDAARAFEQTALEINLEAQVQAPLTAEWVLCAANERDPAPAPLEARLGAVSGDLVCGALGVAVRAEQVADRGDALDASELLDACVDDLQAAAWRDNLVGRFGSRGCIDANRRLMAIGTVAGRVARGQAGPGEVRLMHRLIQQWLAVNTYVPREVLQRAALRAISNEADRSGDALGVLVRGWDVFLFPRVATAMARLDAAVLRDPDYRPFYLDGPAPFDAHGEHHVGLPVAIVEALRAQLELAEAVIEAARLEDEGEAEAVAHTAALLQRAQVMRAMAVGLAQRAGGDASWAAAFATADAALSDMQGRVITAVEAWQRGANPLGIDEADLPLLVDGDLMGDNARFRAASQAFLGARGRAFEAIEDAATALERARDAWNDQRDRDIQGALRAQAHVDRIQTLRAEAGAEVDALCGRPDGLSTDALLEDWHDFDARRCYRREDAPAHCAAVLEPDDGPGDPDRFVWQALLTEPELNFHLCRAGWHMPADAHQRLGAAFMGTAWLVVAEADAWHPNPAYWPLLPCARAGRVTLAECEDGPCAVCGDAAPVLLGEDVLAWSVRGPRPAAQAEAACRQITGFAGAVPTRDALMDEVFGADGGDDFSPRPSLAPCVRGEIGDRVIEIESLALAVQAAYARLSAAQAHYDLDITSCNLAADGAAQAQRLTEAHNDTMSDLRAVKLGAQVASNAAGAAKDCAGFVQGTTPTPMGAGATAAGCGAAAAEAVADSVVDGMDFAMEEAEAKHEALLARLAADVERRVCYNDAEHNLVEVRELMIEVNRALTELSGATVRFDNAVARARTVFLEGRADLAALQGRAIPSLAYDPWLDERATTYVRALRRARRMTYLAVRAVEYEQQATLGAQRLAVFAAQSPDDLQAVSTGLQDRADDVGVNGRAPQGQPLVLSLRREILQVADLSDLPEGNRPLSDVARFRAWLTAPRFAVFDADGVYQGQRLPFSLAPLAALGLGDAGGVPIFAQADCAERLWSVNASIQGGEGLFHGERTSACSANRCRITLEKANTFYSQRCADDGLQVAAIRPSRNLLDSADRAQAGEADRFSKARIGTALNVSAAEFEAGDYDDGASTELAGRGLYGAYALFLPASSLSLNSPDGVTDGLNLNAVDDILLRIDYLSVAAD